MKTAKALLALSLLLLMNVAHAQQTDKQEFSGIQEFSDNRCELICRNLRANLNHRVPEIRANAMQLLIDLSKRHPEFDLDFAILPLMHILKSDDHEGQRILASVALYHLDTDRGEFAIQRRSVYDPSPRVRRHCERIVAFSSREANNGFALASSGTQ